MIIWRKSAKLACHLIKVITFMRALLILETEDAPPTNKIRTLTSSYLWSTPDESRIPRAIKASVLQGNRLWCQSVRTARPTCGMWVEKATTHVLCILVVLL